MGLEYLTKDELELLRAVLYDRYLTGASLNVQEVIAKALNIINDKITRL